MFLWKNVAKFSGDKGDYIDVWTIKIAIKTHHIKVDPYLFQT